MTDLLGDSCWACRVVGAAAAVGFGIAAQVAPTAPELSRAGIWIGIAGVISALGGFLIPIVKMYYEHRRAEIDDRRVEREDRWKRHDLANRMNDIGLTVAHMQAVLSPEEFAELKARMVATEKMALRNTTAINKAAESGLIPKVDPPTEDRPDPKP